METKVIPHGPGPGSFTFELEGFQFESEIDYTYHKGSPDTRSWECPMGYPGDPECVEVDRVWVKDAIANPTWLNIVDYLDSGEIETIEECILKSIQSEK
jgi:hypothetical protein